MISRSWKNKKREGGPSLFLFLPMESEPDCQVDVQWVFIVVGLEFIAILEIVVNSWFSIEAEFFSDGIFDTDGCQGGEL